MQVDVAMAQAARVHPRTRSADGEGHVPRAWLGLRVGLRLGLRVRLRVRVRVSEPKP